MKKRLLLSLALALGTLSTFALNVGDYVFTPTAKLKITGDNLLQNGNFATSTTSWTGQDGAAAVSTDNWSIEEGVGPNGENVLQSNNGGDGLDNYIYQAVELPAGIYVVSLQVKGTANGIATATTVGTANYVDAFFNTSNTVDKTGARQIFTATDNIIDATWTTFSDTVKVEETGYLIVGVGRLDAGTQVTNFSVSPASEVYDTRIAQRRIDYDKQLLARPEFTEGREDFEPMVNALDAGLQANDLSAFELDVDDVQSVTDFMEQFATQETAFLNANSYDLIGNGIVGAGSGWWTASNAQRISGTYGDWVVGSKGDVRWFHQGSDGYGTPARDMYQTSGSYKLAEGYNYIQKSLPAGKYMFQIDAYGHNYSSNYNINYNDTVTTDIFIGTDTITVKLSPRDYNTYFIIADVAAPETQGAFNVIAGYQHQALARGGEFMFRYPVLRYIGADAAGSINKFNQDNQKATQLNAAKVMIDSANVVVAKTEYPWGKETLRTAITAQQALYDALDATESTEALFVLDANGGRIDDGNGNYTTKTVADSLMQVMRGMRTAIQAYYGENAPVTNLVTQINKSQSTYDNSAYANASASTKTALQNALTNANALLTTFMAQTDSLEGDAAKSAAQVEALTVAEEDFTATAATYANPSEIQLVNPFFATWSGSKNPTWTGWSTTGSQTDNGCWRGGTTNAAFEGGYVAYQARGNTTNSRNIVTQKVTLTHAGAYEFVCQIASYGLKASMDGNLTTDHMVYYWAKDVASADTIGKISVHTRMAYVDSLGYGERTPEYFVITLNKADETPTEYQFGFDAMQNGPNGTYNKTPGANHYEFGGNHIRYYGNYNQYKADVQSTLQAEITKAQNALTEAATLSDQNEYKAVKNAILAAQSAIDGTTLAIPIDATTTAPFMMTCVGWVAPSTEEAAAKRYAQTNSADDQKAALETKAYLQLQRAETAFQTVVTGIQGVKVADSNAVKAAVKGVYNLAGQKVAETTTNLPAGLYIVNGKKVLVK